MMLFFLLLLGNFLCFFVDRDFGSIKKMNFCQNKYKTNFALNAQVHFGKFFSPIFGLPKKMKANT